jgi:hypothetical protein
MYVFFNLDISYGSKEVSLDVKPEEMEYLLLPYHQNGGQNHDINVAIRPFENVELFQYLGTSVS